MPQQGWTLVQEAPKTEAPGWTLVEPAKPAAKPAIDWRGLSALDPNIPADADPSGGPVLKWVQRHPGTTGAIVGGTLAALTDGASLFGGGIGGQMLAEATGAGGGTIAGNAAAGRAQDPRETLVNATLGAGGPIIGRTIGGAIRLARQTPTAALDVAEHLPFVGGTIRLARLPGQLRELADTFAPAAEAPVETAAARAMTPEASHAPAGRASPSAPPLVDASGRPVTGPGGYAGPERRGPSRVSTPDEDALYAEIRTVRARMNSRPQTSPQAQENAAMRAAREADPRVETLTPEPAHQPPPPPEPPPRWQPDPEDVAAERAFKQGLLEQNAKAQAARVRLVPAHTPAPPPTPPRLPASWQKLLKPEPPQPSSAPLGLSEHATMWTRPAEHPPENAARDMRTMLGADEAGHQMGLPAETVRDLSGTPVKRRPIVASLADLDLDYRRSLLDPKRAILPPAFLAALIQQLMGTSNRGGEQ